VALAEITHSKSPPSMTERRRVPGGPAWTLVAVPSDFCVHTSPSAINAGEMISANGSACVHTHVCVHMHVHMCVCMRFQGSLLPRQNLVPSAALFLLLLTCIPRWK
jgi:hypothetical protein